MLYVNGKFLNLDSASGENSHLVTEYQALIKKLRNRFGRYVTLRNKREPKVNATGLLEQPPNSTIPLRISVSGKNGKEEWLYAEVAPETKDGVLAPDTTQKIVRYGELTIDLENEPDFAYFFIGKHSMFEKGIFYILDEEAMEDQKADERTREAQLTQAIYGENSPLVVDKTLLVLVAKRWGIANAEKMAKSTIQNRLFENVWEAENKKADRGVSEFLADIKSSNDGDKLKIAGIVRDAIDKGILIFDVADKYWKINYQDGTYRDVLNISISDLHRKDEALILYMQSDNHLYTLLRSAMGKEGEDLVGSIDIDKVRTTEDFSILRTYARSLDINLFKKSKDTLRQEILERIQQTT
jgi:hypothetical protein